MALNDQSVRKILTVHWCNGRLRSVHSIRSLPIRIFLRWPLEGQREAPRPRVFDLSLLPLHFSDRESGCRARGLESWLACPPKDKVGSIRFPFARLFLFGSHFSIDVVLSLCYSKFSWVYLEEHLWSFVVDETYRERWYVGGYVSKSSFLVSLVIKHYSHSDVWKIVCTISWPINSSTVTNLSTHAQA